MERYPTLRAAIDEFLAELMLADRTPTARTYRQRLAPLAALAIYVHELDRARCLRLASEMQPHLKPATLRLTVYAWRSFNSWCREKGYSREAFADVPKPPKRAPKHVYLSERQLLALYQSCRDEVDRAALLLLSLTGLRNAELCGLEWRDVDLAEGVVRVRGKGSRWRAVAIDARVAGSLTRLPGDRAGRVFDFGPEALRVRCRNLGRRAGIAGVHPHQLRHSFAVAFLEASGEDTNSLQVLLGHSSPIMTAWYVRSVREAAALRVQRRVDLAERLFGSGP